jgi:TolB-like protein/Tfp pilus assembly protein PilF
MLTPGAALGPYEVVAQIGYGGMGEVYRARDTRLGRDVAIKLLPAEFAVDPERLRRFEQEARAVATLDHPNILAIHDVGTHEGSPYIVTELLEGENLRERLSGGPMPVRKAVEVAVQMAQGLAAAHAKGIVHRDLKPGNVFITKGGHVKILDFGIAKLVAPRSLVEPAKATTVVEATEAGTTLGTVGYMSPEQVRGQSVDHRTDIFAFGCVLYEMLSGRSPFRRDTAADTASAILHDEPPPLPSDVPRGLDRAVRRCLEKSPEDRFSSAHDLALALQAISAAAESVSPRPPRGVRGAAWVQRHTSVVLGVGAAVLVITAGLTAWLWKGKAGTQTQIRSIAVLPLKNLSGDPAQEYFAEGMHEALTTAVSKIGALRVISSTSATRYKGTDKPLPQIARELNVDAVVEGSVLVAGDRVRINAQLIQAATDAHLWAESYDRPLRDVLGVHDEVARAIASRVKVALTPEEERRLGGAREVDPDAYREYLKGNFYVARTSPDAPQAAIRHYEAAIARDPSYAPAYAGLSFAYANLGSWWGSTSSREASPKARAAALRALELDNQLPEGHIALANVQYLFEWNWPGAESSFRSGMALNPRSSYARVLYANYLTAMGRFDESIALGRETLELDPVSPLAYNEVAWALDFAGRENEALEYYGKASDLEPAFLQTLVLRGEILARTGRTQEAISHLQKAEVAIGAGTATLGLVAYGYTVAGRRADALRVLERLQHGARGGFVWPGEFVWIYCGLGEKQRALDWLEKAYAERDPILVFLKVHPMYRGLRDEPRYQEMLRRMRLDQ